MRRWEEESIFSPEPDQSKPKKFLTVPFPYMNGPLHIGHGFTYTRVDAYARFKRMQGYNVLFPFAWHWTGQPIVAAAERLASGDKAMIHEFVEIDRVPLKELSKFYDPKYMAQYYTESGKVALQRLGLSIDWSREFHTTDLEPTFNQFVLWQMSKLRELGYVTKGTHPVVWCPRDQSPTGDHDRVAGEGVTWEEFTLVMFGLMQENEQFQDVFLPAATFRPETIFGVTNLWLNPDAKYVEFLVNGKSKWIVSSIAASKLGEQLRQIKVLRELNGSELIGQCVRHPLDPSKRLPIFPASFVDPGNGTGVVYSVPAHAPMDYVALRDLQNDLETQRKFGISSELVSLIHPIALISIPGMGEFPAVEITEKMAIQNQQDPRVEQATNEIYKKEFHQGVLNKNTGRFEGRKVSEVKPLIIEELKVKGLADSMYDLPEKVICRCLTQCVVKILEDQWFLKYSDPAWKAQAHDCINSADIFPESARQWFHDVIDWMKDWPCARRVGLGTPLPWAPGWIVETLSDSTIYMSFYTIRKSIVKLALKPEQLTMSFFDFVFLGIGDLDRVFDETGVSSDKLQHMRDEFLYWYPVDLRNSAKELIPNHLTFYVFNHCALFPRELWPDCISANGMMMIEGMKVSKSKGNVITVSNALSEYGADTLRGALIGGAEGLDDMDWREKNVRDIQSKIKSLPSFVTQLSSSKQVSDVSSGLPELWLENQVQKHIESIATNLDSMKTKSAFQEAFFTYWNDLRYYMTRTESRPPWLIDYSVDVFVKLLSPFLPYTAEQINSDLGSSSLVSTSPFPGAEESRMHPEAEIAELAIQNLAVDFQKIVKVLSTKPNHLHIYVAPDWQYLFLTAAIEARIKKERTSETLQKFFAAQPQIPKKDVANALPKITNVINDLGEDFARLYLENFSKVDEFGAYADSKSYLESILGVRITLHPSTEAEKYDPKGKSAFALPFKPALYLE